MWTYGDVKKSVARHSGTVVNGITFVERTNYVNVNKYNSNIITNRQICYHVSSFVQRVG